MTDDAREAKAPLLERWATRVLCEGQEPRASHADNPIHVLDDAEHAALRAIERRAVLRSALAGVLSALVCGYAAVWAGDRYAVGEVVHARHLAAYWGIQGLVTIVASVVEIGYLYWDALVSVRKLAHAAGLDLHAEARGVGGRGSLVASALARAALELPDPDTPVHGVDPRRESSAVALLVASIVYKAKIALSTFLLKALVRRALGRFATRAILAFAAVPINAVWNGVVTFLVLREARVRAMGPSAVEALLPKLVPEPGALSIGAKRAVVRAAGAAIVRSEHAHPNLVLFLRRMIEHIGPLGDRVVLDDTKVFLDEAKTLSEDERKLVTRVVIAAAVLDGRTALSERRLLATVVTTLGGQARSDEVLRKIESLRVAFVGGRHFAVDSALAV